MIEYLTSNLWLVWTLVFLIGLILEVSSGDFFIMCFALGALPSIIAAACGLPLVWQVVIWVIATILCLLFVRPFALRYLHSKDNDRPSNADALMGREGRVTGEIKPGSYGWVQVDGDVWKAVSHETITVGTRVRIVGRDSIIVTVKPIGNQADATTAAEPHQ